MTIDMKYSLTALVFALVSCTLAAQPADPAKVEKPNTKVGDSRTYLVLDSLTKVVQRTEDQVVTEVSDTQVQVLDKAANSVSIYDNNFMLKRSGDRVFSPGIQLLAFPLYVGKKWGDSYSFTHPTCGKTTAELKSEVVGWESVTVPAGTFRALKVESKGFWSSTCGGDRMVYRYWYSPNEGSTVRSESLIYFRGSLSEGVIRELKEFRTD